MCGFETCMVLLRNSIGRIIFYDQSPLLFSLMLTRWQCTLLRSAVSKRSHHLRWPIYYRLWCNFLPWQQYGEEYCSRRHVPHYGQENLRYTERDMDIRKAYRHEKNIWIWEKHLLHVWDLWVVLLPSIKRRLCSRSIYISACSYRWVGYSSTYCSRYTDIEGVSQRVNSCKVSLHSTTWSFPWSDHRSWIWQCSILVLHVFLHSLHLH